MIPAEKKEFLLKVANAPFDRISIILLVFT